jgi:hypothetical protein
MLEWECWFILQHLMIFNLKSPRLAVILGLLGVILLVTILAACSTFAESQIQNIAPSTITPLPPSPTIIWFPLSATPTLQALPTKMATPEQKPGVGGFVLSDSFSSADVWNTAVSDLASVDVSNNQLTIAVQPGISDFSMRQNVTFNDFYAEITAQPRLCRGTDEYGLLFRAPNNVAYYRYVILCDGKVRVDRFSIKTPHLLLPAISSADVPPGAPGEVRLGVWAAGSEFHFFLNDHYQFSVSDKNYPAGAIGVFVQSTGDTPVTVSFSDLEIYDVTYIQPTTTPHP